MSRRVVPGFECEFTEELPGFVRSLCPICLLVLREPFQVTCCGKSFCQACIEEAYDTSDYCPACKQDDYEVFPDKGLQQDLYSFRVYCSNRSDGCSWQGELRELEGHMNSSPSKKKQFVGCLLTRIKCVHCGQRFCRSGIEQHQNLECFERPFICELCEEYESTFENVINEHAQCCKCRPVDCPNLCGVVVQHQRLEEHLSRVCELSEVECEFSHAGCEAKTLRRDVPSHRTDNMAAHMALLAKENRQLKSCLGDQSEALVSFLECKAEIDAERKQMKRLLKEQATLIKAFRKQLMKQNTTSAIRTTTFKKKVKRRRKSL